MPGVPLYYYFKMKNTFGACLRVLKAKECLLCLVYVLKMECMCCILDILRPDSLWSFVRLAFTIKFVFISLVYECALLEHGG